MAHIQLFLSTVSAEFRSYRDALRHDLERPNVTVTRVRQLNAQVFESNGHESKNVDYKRGSCCG